MNFVLTSTSIADAATHLMCALVDFRVAHPYLAHPQSPPTRSVMPLEGFEGRKVSTGDFEKFPDAILFPF
jgi:hypothetical protein